MNFVLTIFYLLFAKLVIVLVNYLKRLNLFLIEFDIEMLLFSNQNDLTVLKEAILALLSSLVC